MKVLKEIDDKLGIIMEVFFIIALMIAFMAGRAHGAELPWAVGVSMPTPCQKDWNCLDPADRPAPDFINHRIYCHPSTADACQDFVDAMNQAHERRVRPVLNWVLPTPEGNPKMEIPRDNSDLILKQCPCRDGSKAGDCFCAE